MCIYISTFLFIFSISTSTTTNMKFLCNTSLHLSEKQYMIQQFPSSIKLSYETVAHKKVSQDYSICVAIPFGRKAYIWWTYYKQHIVCCLLELNRIQAIGENVSFVNAPCPKDFELGTILSGVLIDENNAEDIPPVKIGEEDSLDHPTIPIATKSTKYQHFVVDDVFMYKGHVLNQFQPHPFQQKIPFLVDMFQQIRPMETTTQSLYFHYHHFWERNCEQEDDVIPPHIQIPYNVRFLQYRNIYDICPHINVSIHKKPIWNPMIIADQIWDQTEKPCVPNWQLDLYKSHYNQNCLFWVRADIAYDVYYLYAKDAQKKPTLYQYAFIPNYKTSVMMNRLFRSIKENENIDYIEESDDEDVYEDIRRDKFVNLQKTSLMECTFDRKFRKWIPLREIHDQTLLHQIPYINQLVLMKTHGGNTNRTTTNHPHNTPYKTSQKYKHPRPSFHKKHSNYTHNRPHKDIHKNV